MNAANLLKHMMMSIDIPKPPTDITAALLVDRLTDKVVKALTRFSIRDTDAFVWWCCIS